MFQPYKIKPKGSTLEASGDLGYKMRGFCEQAGVEKHIVVASEQQWLMQGQI